MDRVWREPQPNQPRTRRGLEKALTKKTTILSLTPSFFYVKSLDNLFITAVHLVIIFKK